MYSDIKNNCAIEISVKMNVKLVESFFFSLFDFSFHELYTSMIVVAFVALQ